MKLFFGLAAVFVFLYSTAFSQGKDTIETNSGLKYVILEKGSGTKAVPGKYAEVHYTLYINGKQIETSRNGEPFDFTIGKGMVIKGWDEGIALMSVGDKFSLIIPPSIGYGDKGAGDLIPPGSILVFDVELMSISDPKKSLMDVMLPLALEGKTSEAVEKYYAIKNSAEKNDYNIRESQISYVAYKLIRAEKFKEALDIMKLDIKEYPESANAHDTYAEVCYNLNDFDNAINYYEKSLSLNPDNTNAKDALKRIREKIGFTTILKENYFDKSGNPLTGKGVLIGDMDSGIDVFHPMFFFADGGSYNWIDVNSNNSFDPGIDAVDYNGNGNPANEYVLNTLEIKDLSKFLEQDSSVFQPNLDFLYTDKNKNGIRDFGEKNGFTESDPTYGEQLFIAIDENKNNRLDVNEKLIALKTSKVRAVREKSGTIRRRGIDLIKTEPDESGHGTGVNGIILGGHKGVQKIHGLAPDAELVVANLKYSVTPGFVKDFPDYINFLRDEKINILLIEDGEWMYEFMDGSSEAEMLLKRLTEEGVTVIGAAGNLSGGKMHIKDTVKANNECSYNFTVIEKNSSTPMQKAFISMLWRNPETIITFTVTTPEGIQSPKLTNGTDIIKIGNIELYYSREVSPRGTVMFKIGMSRPDGNSVAGNWNITAMPDKDIVIDGYLVDLSQSWGNISYWDSQKLTDYTTVTFPSTADEVISVGAHVVYKSRKNDLVGDLAKYSGWGYNINGKLGVDITAPSHYSMSTGKNNSYIIFSGTSAAAPHVVGTAALLKQYDMTLSHSRIKYILIQSAVKDSFTGDVPNPKWGYGKLNTEGAIKFLINIK